MKKHLIFSRVIAFVLCLMMVVSVLPISTLAITMEKREDDYYKLISQKDWELAPGVVESEIVLNNATGTHRQVAHVVEVDLSNPYTKVMPSYSGMKEALEAKKYSTGIMSQQTAYAEANGYGNVVAAMNISLSWYDSAYYKSHPELVGEPLGYLVMDGDLYVNSQGQTSGAQTCLVINFDEKDGVARPADMPKVQIRATKDAITGWEEQVIPANFGFLVKDGKNVNSKNHTSDPASRSFMGIKADGTFVMVMNDGRQAPYSAGFNSYEMAEFMLSLGCVYAVNGDGGGSSAFLSQRPGEELKINCSPSDGAERETTHGILVISTAPATGEFEQAHISSVEDYYTPGSTVEFEAIGTDLVGTVAEIPANAVWQLADPSFGTIADGVFVSNGKQGEVVVQMAVDGEVVGEDSIHIVMPDTLTFAQENMVVPFGKTVDLGLSATYDNKNVVLKASDVIFTLTDAGIGTIAGFDFTASEEGTDSTAAVLTAQVGTVSATTNLSLGKGSEIVYNFENQDLTGWSIYTNYGKYGPAGPNGSVTKPDGSFWYHGQNERGYISIVDATTGKVKNGSYALAVECDFTQIFETGYHALNLKFPTIDCTDTVAIGFWLYIPHDARHAQLGIGAGGFDNGQLFDLNEGWHYVTAQAKDNKFYYINISIDDRACSSLKPYYDYVTEPNLNGKYTFYIDDITLDYSTAVDDREAPIFSAPVVINPVNETSQILNGQLVEFNNFTFEAPVVENTAATNAVGIDASSAKAYVDGKEVACTYKNGKITVAGVTLSDGYHTVKFSIADKMGNESWIDGNIVVSAGKDTAIKVIPQDDTADRLLVGSLYWLDVVATNIETLDKVEMVFDMNNASSWELEGLTVADGFTATYEIQADDNIATIIIERTGKVTATGDAILASFPVRTWVANHTSYEGYEFATPAWLVGYGTVWAQSIEIALEKGIVTFVDETEDTFGMEDILVDTELFFTNYSRKSVEGAQAWLDAKRAAGEGWHEHTAEAVADKAPTCTKDGYTGRTYCAVCDSVVDWGTPVPATGHAYEVVGNKLVCDCGEENTASGLVTVGDKTYYLAAGLLTPNWVTIDDEWYYFDTTTYAAVETLDNGYVTFEFEADGKLTSGEWYHTAKGSKYYYGPSNYAGAYGAARWYEIDGKKYCFDRSGYCYKGIHFVDDSNSPVYTWYDFGTDGAMIEKFVYTGAYACEGNLYYLEDGVSAMGMFEYEGGYYYAADTYFAAVRNVTRYCNSTRGLMPEGTYTFGGDGRMVDKALYTVDGVLYYFEKGNISTAVDTFEINGNYYAVDENGKVLFTGRYTDASGIAYDYVNGVGERVKKNGLFGDYVFVDDVQLTTYYGLVKIGDDFYYVNEGAKIVRNMRKYVNKTNGLTFADGTPVPQAYFFFDADGKMVIENEDDTTPDTPVTPPVTPSIPDGLHGDYVYVNGEKLYNYYGLVKVGDDFYYVNDGAKIVRNMRKYVSKPNGLTFADGTPVPQAYFFFDEDGKMILN